MRWLKYAGSALCILLILGTLPSMFVIAAGLAADNAKDTFYFASKLGAYIAVNVVLAIVAAKLFKSAKEEMEVR